MWLLVQVQINQMLGSENGFLSQRNASTFSFALHSADADYLKADKWNIYRHRYRFDPLPQNHFRQMLGWLCFFGWFTYRGFRERPILRASWGRFSQYMEIKDYFQIKMLNSQISFLKWNTLPFITNDQVQDVLWSNVSDITLNFFFIWHYFFRY